MAQLNPVTPLYSPSVTATNGSDTITVTGSVDCSFVRSGTTVFITGRQPVRAISGTVPNGSGVSTIKLKVAWSYATTTGELLAINTYEGLADAIYQLGALVDAAEANQNKVFEYKGSYDLAAAGALPPAPTSGSALYRISTQATVASRLYRVGEPIYYDNLTSQWRSMWEAMGTAAFANVQTSQTDASTPNALMRRGDWGFGEGADGATFGGDLNSLLNTQILQTAAATTPAPANYSGSAVSLSGGIVQHFNWALSDIAFQVALVSDGRRFERMKTGNVWDTQWRDVTAGIGSPITQDINCDTITYGGLYRATGGTRPTARNQFTIHINRAANAAAAQIMVEELSGGAGELCWRARIGDGTWSGYRTAYHRGNIVGAVSQSAGVPTGAIIQRGSNVNGSFVLFADGSAINYPNAVRIPAHAINTQVNASRAWPFAFASLSKVLFSPIAQMGAGSQSMVGVLNSNGIYSAASSLTSATLASYSYFNAVTEPVDYHVVGFGFWF